MNDPNEADQLTQRTPQQIAAIIEQLRLLLAINWAGGSGKVGLEAAGAAGKKAMALERTRVTK
jgi:hypothetical protein